MLVLSRKMGERFRVACGGGKFVWIHVVEIDRGNVRLGVEAPREFAVMREELLPAGEQYHKPGGR